MLDAGRYFLRKQQRSTGVSESELIRIAVASMGLEDLTSFVPEERIIEYRLRKPGEDRLAELSLREFIDETASESVAPGGGSVAAAVGALGAALGTMVANLSAHKRGWDARWDEFSGWAEAGQRTKEKLVRLVDEDTRAFGRVMDALGMPKDTAAEKAARAEALEAANIGALEVPWQTMRVAAEAFPMLRAMADQGNIASASDGGVGALCARAAIRGAWLNVRTNAAGIKNKSAIATILAEGAKLEQEAARQEAEILAIVDKRMSP
jgi:glutamate formiminotransferase/formiminotetrahydrofolate cyclodeaminase